MTLLEFQERFSTEEECLQYLFERRWPKGFVCPRCQCEEAYYHRARRLQECKSCRYQVSVTAGTIFHKTRTPLRCWFWMIFLMARNKDGYSMLGLRKLLGIHHYKTVWMMEHKIGKAMAERNDRYRLAGLVEMDDAFFGGRREEARGRGAQNKVKVIVAAENRGDKPGFASIDVVDRLDEESVRGLARKRIQAGQTIRTDGLSSFATLTKDGYKQDRVVVGKPVQASEKFPWVHTVISNCKGQFQGTQRGVSLKHLRRYLAEFS